MTREALYVALYPRPRRQHRLRHRRRRHDRTRRPHRHPRPRRRRALRPRSDPVRAASATPASPSSPPSTRPSQRAPNATAGSPSSTDQASPLSRPTAIAGLRRLRRAHRPPSAAPKPTTTNVDTLAAHASWHAPRRTATTSPRAPRRPPPTRHRRRATGSSRPRPAPKLIAGLIPEATGPMPDDARDALARTPAPHRATRPHPRRHRHRRTRPLDPSTRPPTPRPAPPRRLEPPPPNHRGLPRPLRAQRRPPPRPRARHRKPARGRHPRPQRPYPGATPRGGLDSRTSRQRPPPRVAKSSAKPVIVRPRSPGSQAGHRPPPGSAQGGAPERHLGAMPHVDMSARSGTRSAREHWPCMIADRCVVTRCRDTCGAFDRAAARGTPSTRP